MFFSLLIDQPSYVYITRLCRDPPTAHTVSHHSIKGGAHIVPLPVWYPATDYSRSMRDAGLTDET